MKPASATRSDAVLLQLGRDGAVEALAVGIAAMCDDAAVGDAGVLRDRQGRGASATLLTTTAISAG